MQQNMKNLKLPFFQLNASFICINFAKCPTKDDFLLECVSICFRNIKLSLYMYVVPADYKKMQDDISSSGIITNVMIMSENKLTIYF